MQLALLLTAPPMFCWFLLSRQGLTRWIVAALLGLTGTALAAFAGARFFFELVAAHPPVSVAVIALGLWAQRRPLRGAGIRVLAAWLAIMVCCCNPMLFRWGHEPFLPAIPSDLEVLHDEELGCAQGGCYRRLIVAPNAFVPAQGCSRKGWLIDRTEICVEVRPRPDGTLEVQLIGASP